MLENSRNMRIWAEMHGIGTRRSMAQSGVVTIKLVPFYWLMEITPVMSRRKTAFHGACWDLVPPCREDKDHSNPLKQSA